MIAEVALAAIAYAAPCQADPLVPQLRAAGFTGRSLKFAWAIAMRESRGHPRSVSRGGDFGLFQFNRAAWSKAAWWDERRLLQPAYNASIAFSLSQAGHTFYPWDIDGAGRHLGRYSSAATFRVFVQYVKAFPC
jgi:hypothetical protein